MAVNAAQTSLLRDRTLHLATCWKIKRTDDVQLHFTDHDEPLTLPQAIGGHTYTPALSVMTSAREKAPTLQTRNMEVVGIIDSAQIDADDIRAGRYREAEVVSYIVDWRYPWLDYAVRDRYWIEEITWGNEQWVAQLTGISRWLRATPGDYYTRHCRHDLGDVQCGVALGPLTETLTVDSVVTARKSFNVTGLTSQDAGYWKYGLLVWQTGDNADLEFEVAGSSDTSAKIWLRFKTPFDIGVGDTATIYPGCNKLQSTCVDKFNNILNFGGFPFLPGTDKLLKTPNAKFE